MTVYEKARAFIYRNARPIDLARWRFHFEGGAAQDVWEALAFYQNVDGGFGHGLEADCWNPASAPIQTWNAACILMDTRAPREHPLVQGLLRYLDSGADFDESRRQWLNTVPSNNDHPHAIWWGYGENGSEFLYNPTAALAGFALLHAGKDTPLCMKAHRIADEAVAWFLTDAAPGEQHVLGCFLMLRECLRRAGEVIPAGLDDALHAAVRKTICTDPEKWRTEYVCRPSMLLLDADNPFYEDVREAIDAECAFLPETQGEDGAWPVAWQWWTNYPEFTVAENWWKSVIIIERMRFLTSFGKDRLLR